MAEPKGPTVDDLILESHDAFRGYMLNLMRANAYKKGASWKQTTCKWLFDALERELDELRGELCSFDRNPDRIMEECADVANFCMMIFDNVYQKQNTMRTLSEGVSDDRS